MQSVHVMSGQLMSQLLNYYMRKAAQHDSLLLPLSNIAWCPPPVQLSGKGAILEGRCGCAGGTRSGEISTALLLLLRSVLCSAESLPARVKPGQAR